MNNSVTKDELTARIAALEALAVKRLAGTDDTKKPRNVTDKGLLAKAKMVFYHENKMSKPVQDMLKKKYNISSNDVVKPSFAEWRKVKTCTDELFDKLPASQVEKLKKRSESAKLPKNDEGVEM